jgi:hypothetical protein
MFLFTWCMGISTFRPCRWVALADRHGEPLTKLKYFRMSVTVSELYVAIVARRACVRQTAGLFRSRKRNESEIHAHPLAPSDDISRPHYSLIFKTASCSYLTTSYSLLSSEIIYYLPDDLLNEENTKYFATPLQRPYITYFLRVGFFGWH